MLQVSLREPKKKNRRNKKTPGGCGGEKIKDKTRSKGKSWSYQGEKTQCREIPKNQKRRLTKRTKGFRRVFREGSSINKKGEGRQTLGTKENSLKELLVEWHLSKKKRKKIKNREGGDVRVGKPACRPARRSRIEPEQDGGENR